MKSRFFLVFGICFVFFLLLQCKRFFWQQDAVPTARSDQYTIIIDPGHGGEDGGAVSVLGDVESHINLAIALKLEQVLLFYGIEPVVLRREDISLHDPQATTIKEKKSTDLKNRVALVNHIENGFLLSIHQNIFTEEKYAGAQVFYNPEAQEFASLFQDLLRENLDPQNNRMII